MSPFFLFMLYVFAFSAMGSGLIMRCKMGATEFYISRFKKSQEKKDGDNQEAEKKKLKVVFLHPDLGIGGAERLIVDAAVSLQKQEEIPVEVLIYTNNHQKDRAFTETVDGTLKVIVRGYSNFPSSIFGRGKVVCATLRMIYAAFMACWSHPDTDVFVVDQVSAAMITLDFFAHWTPRVFYCHFPDQLCDSNRNADGSLNSTVPGHESYRGVMNKIEALGMTKATKIFCNSLFSRGVTLSTFPDIGATVDPEPLYPPVAPITEIPSELDEKTQLIKNTVEYHTVFASINRYERKKNIELAIKAFSLVTKDESINWEKPPFLIIAGGHDPSLSENVEYAKELKTYAIDTLGIKKDQIAFLFNISSVAKEIILQNMYVLLYTPSNEHFGICPVEAMARGKPVVAVNNGGPLESVLDINKSPESAGGIVCNPEGASFSEAMITLVKDKSLAASLGQQGKTRATTLFSTEFFGQKLAQSLKEICSKAEEDIAKDLATNDSTLVSGGKKNN